MSDNENKDIKNNTDENHIIDENTPIAPPTELPSSPNDVRIDKSEYIWSRVEKLEKAVDKVYILSIISLFAGIIGFFCCCNLAFILNIVVIVLGIVYMGESNRIGSLDFFSDFESVRIKDVKKKARLILIFGIIGLVISLAATIIPFVASFIFR